MKLAAVICPNGLGHYRRTVGVLARLLALEPNWCVDMYCEHWQVERMGDWPTSSDMWASQRVTFRPGIVTHAPRWSAEPAPDAKERRQHWLGALDRAVELRTVDLVLSDNLPDVLQIRADAVLVGSFLWSDVLEAAHGGEAESFVRAERELLARHRPPMLCVEMLAMPGVINRTCAVRLPWMCEHEGTPRRLPLERYRVALLGGATNAAGPLLRKATLALQGQGWDLAIPEAEAGNRGVERPFGFQPSDFASCHVVVCRPGAGTLHDCIGAQTPVVALHEPGNIELEHNGRQVEAHGLGRYLGSAPSSAEIRAAVADVLDEGANISERMGQLAKDGLERAAIWLRERLN